MASRSLSAALLLLSLSLFGRVMGQTPATGPSFIGFYKAPASVEAINCPSGEMHTTTMGDRPYGGCCKSGVDCPVATDCFGTTVLMNDGQSSLCTGGMYCMSFTIFDSYPDGTPSAYHLACQTFWRAHTVYKTLDDEAVQTSVSIRTVTVTATPSGGSASGPAVITSPPEEPDSSAASSNSAPGASTNSAASSSSSASASNAWIAGAVIGPIAGLALIVAAFWYMRRRGDDPQKAAELAAYQPQQGGGGGLGGNQGAPPMSQQAYMGHWNPKQTSSPAMSYGTPTAAYGSNSPPQGFGQIGQPQGYVAESPPIPTQGGYMVDSSPQGYGPATSPPQGYASNSPPQAHNIPELPQRSWTGNTGATELSANMDEGR